MAILNLLKYFVFVLRRSDCESLTDALERDRLQPRRNLVTTSRVTKPKRIESIIMGAEVGIASVCGGTILTLVFLSLLGKNVKKRRRATGSKYTPDTQAGNQEDGGDEGGGGDA